MNLDRVSSPTSQDEACSLRSLLTLGCRTRAEAFAKKLQTKLWTLGQMEANIQSDVGPGERDMHSWVTVEARLDPNNSVVTSVPVVSRMYHGDFGLTREDLSSSKNRTSHRNDESRDSEMELWDVMIASSVGRESVDRESNDSSANKQSDSDQYFDFGIDSPLDFVPELRNEEEVMVLNLDDGLPSQPESGCVFTSPVHSENGSSDDGTDEETSFYDVESLSQSPANLSNRTISAAFEVLTLPLEDKRMESIPDKESKQHPNLDPNLLENNIEKIIPNKLTIPGENRSEEFAANKSPAIVTEQEQPAACSEIIYYSDENKAFAGHCTNSDSVVPLWQEIKTPAQDGISTINADVMQAGPRATESRALSQGELEDVPSGAVIPTGKTAQFTYHTRDERICGDFKEKLLCEENALLLGEASSQGLNILFDSLPTEVDDNTLSAVSREMRNTFQSDACSDVMAPSEPIALLAGTDAVLDSNSNSLPKVEQLFISELHTFSSTYKSERISESSSGYADSIVSSTDDSDINGSKACLSENDSDSYCSETELNVAIDAISKDSYYKKNETYCSKDDSNQTNEQPGESQRRPAIEVQEPVKDDNSEKEDEDVISRCHRVQRSTSLRSGKTPPGTPGRKKIVRFADALGLDLALVRTFMDDVPNVPQSAFKDLGDAEHIADSPESQSNALVGFNGPYLRRQDLPLPIATVTSFRTLIACFTSPGSLTDFLDRVKNYKVCLETASMAEDMTLRGTVRCLNIDFHKSVILRVTTDEWLTFTDVNAEYVTNSCDGLSDRFSFNLFCHALQPGQRVIFAISYRVAGQEFWDNNFGLNYVFQCVAERNINSTSSALLASPMSDWLPYM